MARWTPGLHPRAADGKFKSKGDRLRKTGRGRTRQYSRSPTRTEAALRVVPSAVSGALAGAAIGGPIGAAAAGAANAGVAAARVFVLSQRAKRRSASLRT